MRIAGWRLAQRGCLQDDLCCFDPQKTCHRSPAIARTPSVRLLSRLFSFLRFRLPKLRPEIPEFLGGELLLSSVPALAVLLALSAVLMPLPTVVVDLVAVMSLGGSVFVLIASLLVKRSSDFLYFPPLLLLLTLGRLALHLSTARLILTGGYAGEVVESFASLVIRGDILVGAVVFLLMTSVQYLVIVKGSERAAEVGARFALDALPGHQAAIEADRNAGLITGREAMQRRAQLAQRSDFFGRMDGALRFVRGEAIVGLVIVSINAVGGTVLGMLRGNEGFFEAASRYGKLTIGDGLMTQVPALLVSVAAGILVARVERERSLQSSSWVRPPMLVWPGLALFLLALAPGMPHWPLLIVGAAFIIAAWLLPHVSAAQERSAQALAPLELTIPRRWREAGDGFDELFSGLKARLAHGLGLELPVFKMSMVDGPTTLVRYDSRVLLMHQAPDRPLDQRELQSYVVTIYQSLMRHADLWLSLSRVEQDLELLRVQEAELVARALQRVDAATLLAIQRSFLREKLPVLRLHLLVQLVAEYPSWPTSAALSQHIALAREGLCLCWLPELWRAVLQVGTPRILRMSPDSESELALFFNFAEGDGTWVGPQGKRRSLLESIEAQREGVQPVVLLASTALRGALAAQVRELPPTVLVLSIRECEQAGYHQILRQAVWFDLSM